MTILDALTKTERGAIDALLDRIIEGHGLSGEHTEQLAGAYVRLTQGAAALRTMFFEPTAVSNDEVVKVTPKTKDSGVGADSK